MDAPTSFSLALDTDNGSVPPPNRRSTSIEIGSDGVGSRTYTRGYGEGTREAFRLTPQTIATLLEDLRRLGAFDTPWREPERKSIGVGGQNVRLTVDGSTIRIPRHLVPDQRERRDTIVARIFAAAL